MQYPFAIFSEWKPTNEPLFQRTKNGDEYCLMTLYKCFKGQNGTIRDTVKIQCFGSENETVKFLMEKNGGTLKNIPLDVFADRIPYISGGELCYNYRASKISVASSFYFNDRKEETSKTESTPQMIKDLDSM